MSRTNLTLFAPTNRAFDELPEGQLDFLLSNPSVAIEFLLHHFVEVTIATADIIAGDVTFLDVAAGEDIAVVFNGAVILNPGDADEARVIEGDIASVNGPVHIIDNALVSDSLVPLLPEPSAPTSAPTTEMPVTMPGTECDLCFLSNPLTWNMAQDLAEKFGCNLASIETEEERAKMTMEISTHLLATQYWAGGTSSPDNTCLKSGVGMEAEFVWVDGTPFSGDFWAPGQPGTLGFLAVGIDPATGEAAFFDEFSTTTLPSVWECCGGCPQVC